MRKETLKNKLMKKKEKKKTRIKIKREKMQTTYIKVVN
jgi:hypothetical protein